MALIFGGPGLGTLHTGAVVKPTPVASKQAAPNKTTQAKQTVLKQTTPTKTVVTPDPYAAALAAQPSLATLLAQASTQANTLAQRQVNAQVAAIQAQQDQAHATAAAQSAEILKAATAAAQFLTPLGDQAAGDYTAAVQNLGGMVGGYTGGLRDTAQAAQDAAQAQLAGISGNTQTVEGQGANLANLLYGVSGSIPANALATQGLGATALARAIPQQELSYGQQQAIGQIGEGNKTADALNADLITARAKLPDLTSTYLKQFQSSAQDVVNAAHQRLMDANTIRNTTSEIETRKATAKQRAADAAAKLVPVVDIGRSKLTGVLTDQFGHSITKRSNGIEYAQATPGWHFDSTGKSVPDPKPMTPAQQSTLAAKWTTAHHYQSNWDGTPDRNKKTGALVPTGGWVVSPDGQSTVPPTKPGKAFVPKIDVAMSAAHGHITYWDTPTQQWVEPRDPKTGNTIPYDSTKPVALQAKVSNGYWVTFNSSTGKWSKAVDESGQPLIAGTPKAPPAVHYGAPKVGRDGYYYTLDPSTGTMKKTDVLAPEKATATHYSGRYAGADGYWHVYDTSTAADIRLPTRVPAKVAAAGSWEKIKAPDGSIKFYNPTTRVTQDTPFKERVPGSSAAPGGYPPLTASQRKDEVATLNFAIGQMVNGIPAKTNTAGVVIREARPAISRAEASKRLKDMGYFDSSDELKQLAMKYLDKYYPKPGTVVSRLPSGPAALGLIPRIPSDIIGQPTR